MKSMIIGMILSLCFIMAGLIGMLLYALSGGTEELPLFMNRNWPREKALVNTVVLSLEDISELSVKNSSSNIYFKPSEDETLVIKEYASPQMSQDLFVKTASSGNKLVIESDARKKESWITFGKRYHYIEIYLPESYQESIDIKTESGDIFADIDVTFTVFTVKAASGDITLETLTADTISIKTMSGDIFAELLNGEKKIETQSGSISVSEGQGNADITTISGDVKLGTFEGEIDIKTASGDTRVSNLSGMAKVKSLSGDIKLYCTVLSGNVTLESTSGTVFCELPKDTWFRFEANTNSGDIKTYFDESLLFNARGTQAQGEIGGSSDLQVIVQTSSGDIKFHDK